MTADDLAALEEKLSDPMWRLCSGELYSIKTADGRGVIPFAPRPEQVDLLRKLVAAVDKTGPRQLCEIKSRRLGYSTTIGVFIADCLAFRKGFTTTLIDQTQKDDATKKLNGIVKVALESCAKVWPIQFDKANDSAVVVDVGGTGKSEFFAGTKSRGGSNDLLWVSEWGPIQFDDPARSAEIRSGALPSARHGVIVVETTWKGGKGGDLWEVLKPTIEGDAKDWDVHFTPWYLDPRNSDAVAQMDVDAIAYFAKIAPRLQREGITLTDAQLRWWAKERRAQGIFMARENPTFLDECWSSPIQGAVYAEKIEQARTDGRVAKMPVDGSNLVHTSWDLGAPENMVVWYFQIVGREIRFIDCDRNFAGTMTERTAHMIAKGYNYGKHYLPHDAEQTERTGSNFATELRRTGLPGAIVVVPRVASVWIGINHALEMFNALAFRSPQCEDGLTALSSYRTKRQNEGAMASDEPVHDWASHTADAFRMMAEAHRAGLLEFKNTTATPRPDWHGVAQRVRRGMRPQVVSA